MYITYELLKSKDACEDGLEWFRKMFPDGCELGEAIDKLNSKDNKEDISDFVWWFYNNIQQDSRLYKLVGVNWSDGVNGSYGVDESFGILNSCGVDHALFLANKPRQYTIFGVEVSKDRFNEAHRTLMAKLNGWRPTFNRIKALYLANGSNWKLTPIQNAQEINKEEAWADMPKEAIAYVRSLPEFDAAMFEEITGIKAEG